MAPRPTARLGRYSEHLVPECRVSSEEAIRRFSPSRDRTGGSDLTRGMRVDAVRADRLYIPP